MRRAKPLALSALLGGAACLGPYQQLGEKLDVTTPLGNAASTWIQATPTQTTLLVFGFPSTGVDGLSTAPYAIVQIGQDTSVVTTTGVYEASAASITLNGSLRYNLLNEFNKPVIFRTGSTRTNIADTATYALGLAGRDLSLIGSPALGTFVLLDDVLPGLSAGTQAEAECLLRFFHLTVLSSEVRILGFNSPGITQYTSANDFNGILSGLVNISLESLLAPNVTLSYSAFDDFSGMSLTGVQLSQTDNSGNGHLSGFVGFDIVSMGQGDAGPFQLDGQVVYGNPQGTPPSVRLSSGAPSGGAYQLILDGGASFQIDYSVLSTIDVTACVPPT